MSRRGQGAAAGGPSHRSVEIGVAIATFIFSAIVIYGSYRVGIGWGVEGPMAGFFPFCCALMILGASIVNLGAALSFDPRPLFAEWPALRQVAFVLIPTAMYVALIPTIGMYVSSMILIAFFMMWLGRYGPVMIAAIAVGVPVATFLVFEKWFLVPLPKGPLESLIGY
jgi:hypothetical protein